MFFYFYSVFYLSVDYSEYSPEGDYLGENSDPDFGGWLTLAEAEAAAVELRSQPDTLCVWVVEGPPPFQGPVSSYW